MAELSPNRNQREENDGVPGERQGARAAIPQCGVLLSLVGWGPDCCPGQSLRGQICKELRAILMLHKLFCRTGQVDQRTVLACKEVRALETMHPKLMEKVSAQTT